MSVDEQVPSGAAAGLSTAPEADPGPPTRPTGIGLLGWSRWAWRQLTSMRTALLLLFLLVVASVPGSVLPQRRVDRGAVQTYLRENPDLGPWLDRLGLFDVFSSPWFSAIYLLLFVSLVGCVLPRSRQHLSAMRARPPAAPRHLDRLPAHARATVLTPPDPVLAEARRVLRRSRYRVEVGTAPDGSRWVAGERGYLRETGNLVFHVALLVVLVAFAAGHLWGFRGNVVVLEGRSFSNVVTAYDTVDVGPRTDVATLPPFTLALDDLRVTYQEGGQQAGAPREFAAEVTYTEGPGEPPRRAVIAPNAPVEVDGTKVFLTGNGYAPRFTVRDPDGEVVLEAVVPFLPQDGNLTSTGVLKVPDGLLEQLGVSAILLPTTPVAPDGTLRLGDNGGMVSVFPDLRAPRVFLTAFTGDLGVDDGEAQSVFRLDTSRMTQLRDPDDPSRPLAVALAPGETLDLPHGLGSVTFDGVDRFANFQVASDPGRMAALAGAVLAIGALMLSLFVRRRRVWVRATAVGDGTTVVEAAGLSRTSDDGLGPHVDGVLHRTLGTPDSATRPTEEV